MFVIYRLLFYLYYNTITLVYYFIFTILFIIFALILDNQPVKIQKYIILHCSSGYQRSFCFVQATSEITV